MKARKTDLTDAGPGVAIDVSNTDVRCEMHNWQLYKIQILLYKMSQREVTVGRVMLNEFSNWRYPTGWCNYRQGI